MIIRRVKGGEVDAYKGIVVRYKNLIYRKVWRYFPDPDICDDLSQEVFIRFYLKINQFRFRSSVSTYLLRITQNLCIDRLRRQRKETVLYENGYTDDEKVKNRIFLLRTLSKLPNHQRVVLELHYLEGYTHKEIAKILSCPEGTVKSRINRAIERLRRLMKGERWKD